MKRKIIGEGSYGCVHRPSIHCKTIPSPGFNYKTYVSKLMKTKNAKKELAYELPDYEAHEKAKAATLAYKKSREG